MKSQFEDCKTVIPSGWQPFPACKAHPFFPDSLVFFPGEHIENLDVAEDIVKSAVVIGVGISSVMQNNIIPAPINELAWHPQNLPLEQGKAFVNFRKRSVVSREEPSRSNRASGGGSETSKGKRFQPRHQRGDLGQWGKRMRRSAGEGLKDLPLEGFSQRSLLNVQWQVHTTIFKINSKLGGVDKLCLCETSSWLLSLYISNEFSLMNKDNCMLFRLAWGLR